MKKLAFLLVISLFSLFLIFICGSFFIIYQGVKTTCLKAKEDYKENCVNALIKYIQSNNKTFRDKNSAIWALGQLADKKTLPFLYELNKSLPERKKCSGDYLCKYEIKKAIKWCETSNITSWMYKNRDWR